MSRIYDNWERLVAAVLKREQIISSLFICCYMCSRRIFKEEEAETWWLSNRDKVYEKYNDLAGLARLRKFSISGKAGSASNVPVSDKSEENSELGEPGRDGQPLTQSTFNENIKSRNSEVKGTASQIADEWIDNYEPGVHITLRALRDGSRDIKRIQFSRRRFREHDAEAWWLENRAKVYRNYNVVQR